MEYSSHSLSPDLDLLEITDAGARQTAQNFINKLQKER
jgi:hypothetical protein